MLTTTSLIRNSVAAAAVLGVLSALPAMAQDKPIVGLITKTEGNPFFVKMREGAQAKAAELGLELRTFAGDFDGDNESQIAAIESLVAAGAKGFAIVPSDSTAIVPTIQQARDAGLLVIVLDTPLDPIDAADYTFATDNREAGRLIGAWEALKSVGKDDGSVLVVSIDGGCPGVENVKAGIIGATSQQYPHKMASMALETIAKYAETGEKPAMVTEGLDFFDTGATLITAEPVEGVPSISVEEGLALCWG